MKERGTATKIDESGVTVRIDLEGNCAGCMNQELCSSSGSVVSAMDPEGLVKTAGEIVEIEVPARAQAAGAFWLLGIPLALFAGGYAVGSALFRAAGEGPAALLGIGGFVLGLIVAWLFLRGTRMSSRPRIIRVLDREAVGPGAGCSACGASGAM